jgi:putative PIN family toxin of toxin-antitoxin system
MKVFLDTNVLAAAAATRGLCADVFREVSVCHELLISMQVLSELERVLKSKFGVSQDLVEAPILLLQQDSISVEAIDIPKVRLRDKDDLGILGAAVAGGADVLVTGDKELLDLHRVENVEILSPRQFWEKVKTRKGRDGRGERQEPC